MIDRVTGNKALPESVRQDIIERTDGIPLFVEEMTKAVLEAESEGDARTDRRRRSVSRLLQSQRACTHRLMARLDRLGPLRRWRRSERLLGESSLMPLLAAVAGKPETELESALDRLIAAGLLFRHGVPPHASYLFKHALVQDAAYGTLLREPRRALHARIAETLETQFADIAENQPELLARHCTEAGIIEKAATLWGKAGQRSLARSALVEAVEQLTRALTRSRPCLPRPRMRREQIKLQVALTTPLIHVKGYAAPRNQGGGGAGASTDRTSSRRSESLPKTRCCCSRCSMVLGRQAIRRSTATPCANLLRSSWRSPRNKRRASRSWSDIASWVLP